MEVDRVSSPRRERTRLRILDAANRQLLERGYHGVGMVFASLASDGRLRRGSTPEEAAEIAWALASPHQYEYLVIERGWTVERYRRHLEEAITSNLIAPVLG